MNFICECIGLYQNRIRIIEGICNDFDVSVDRHIVHDAIKKAPDNVGDYIIEMLFQEVVNDAVADYGLDENKFFIDEEWGLFYDKKIVLNKKQFKLIKKLEK